MRLTCFRRTLFCFAQTELVNPNLELKLEETANKTLVIGIGNLLMCDEGIGIHVISELEQEGGIPGADLLDGGTGGFHLITYIQSYTTIIFIDASLDDFPAGHIRLLQPRFASDFPKQLSAHEIGLKDMMDAAYLTGTLPLIYLIAISVKEFQDMGMTLSPEVSASFPEVKRIIRQLISQR